MRRPRDLGLPVSGGLAILSVFALLVWALGSGGSRPRGGSARVTSATNVPPWIVPIPACASEAATAMSVEPTPTAGRRPSRVPRPTPTPSVAAALPGAQPCVVSVNSVPWSEVWIDGKNTGKHTPFVDVEIGCGEHRIDFKRPIFRSRRASPSSSSRGRPSNEGTRYPAGPSRVSG